MNNENNENHKRKTIMEIFAEIEKEVKKMGMEMELHPVDNAPTIRELTLQEMTGLPVKITK